MLKLAKISIAVFIFAQVGLFLPIPPVFAQTTGIATMSIDTTTTTSQIPTQTEFKVIDEYKDEADLGNGRKVMRVYSEPRQIFISKGEKKVRPAGWNKFNEDPISKIKTPKNFGYNFSLPFTNAKKVDIMPGNLEIKNPDTKATTFSPLKASFRQYQNEDKHTISEFKNVFKNVDINFIDKVQSRTKQIIINTKPDNINNDSEIIFWESYKVPKGSTILVGDTKYTDVTRTYSPTTVILENKETLLIDSSIIYDSKVKDDSYCDMSQVPVEQIVSYDEKNLTLKIGLVAKGNYLLDKDKVYPIIIDPSYFTCSGTSCVTDFYLSWLTGKSGLADNYLYAGYDYASGVAPCSPAGSASRHAVFKFDVSSIPVGSTITASSLKLKYTGIGCGEYNSYISLQPKKITPPSPWTYSNITYSSIRPYLSSGGSALSLSYTNLATDCPSGICTWNLDNSMVQTWVDNSAQNYGFLIEPQDNFSSGSTVPASWSSKQRLFKFYASDYSVANSPYLDVTYTALPDLTLDTGGNGATVNKSTFTPGELMIIGMPVKNIGIVAPGKTSYVYYYFKKDSYTYSDTYKIGQSIISNLNPGAVYPTGLNYTIPVGTPAGTYYLYFWIDGGQVVTESSETNNQYYFTQTITVAAPAIPDLIFSSTPTVSPTSPVIGGPITINATVKNNGTATANSTNVNYYIDDNYVGQKSVSSLTAGSSVSASYTTTVPTYVSSGSLNVESTISSVTGEINTNNNSVIITPNFLNGFDFSPINFSITNTSLHYWGKGETISISGQIKNTGTVSASNVDYTMYLNKNGVFYQLTNVSPSSFSVSANGQTNITLTGTIPDGLPAYANYKVQVNVDPSLNFTESNGANNTMTTANSVDIQQWSSDGGGNSVPANSLPAMVTIPIGTRINSALSIFNKLTYQAYSKIVADSTANNSTGDPVNSRNGAFELEQNDFVLSGRGFPIQISRVYNSKTAARNERFGAGWNSTNHMYYFQDPTTKDVQINLGGSVVSYFTSPDNGATYVAEKGDSNTLYNEGAYLIYKTIDGIKYKFSFKPDTNVTNVGMIDSVIDTNNNITQFTYITKNGVKLLSAITDPSGRSIQFTYPVSDTDPSWDKIKEIRENLSGNSRLIASYTYDSNNNLIQAHQENFYQTESTVSLDSYYTYDANGLMLTYTDTRGTILYNEYDATGRVIKQYEKNPRLGSTDKRLIYEITYSDVADPSISGSAHCTITKNYRDANNFYSEKVCFNSDELKIYRERGNNIEKWTYNASGLPISYIDANANTSNYEYDTKRRLTKETLPDTTWRTVNTFVYEDTFNRMTKKTETVSAVSTPATPVSTKITNYAYDSYGNLLTATDALNNIEHREYNTNGTLKKYTSKTNQIANYTYDTTGNYVASESTVVTQADNTTQTITKNYGYDVYGHKTSYTDPRNLNYIYKYDYRGNLRQETNPINGSKYYTYDKENNKITETDELGRVTNYTYDTDINHSLLKIEKLGTGGPITYERQYDWVGNLKTEIDPLLRTTSYVYNEANRIVIKTDPIKITDYDYYSAGQLKKETNTGGARTDYFYDARGNNTEIRKYYDASNYLTTKAEYDGFNRKTKDIDGKNNATFYTYDLMNHVTQIDDALNNHTKYFYDAIGNKTSEQNPREFTTSYVYDGINRLIKKIDANDKYTLYFYDANGNVIKNIDRENSNGTNNTHVTNYQYDNLNRQTKVTDALNNFSSQIYDVVSNVTSKTDQMNRTWTYTYDAFNRLTDENDPASNNTHYTYDKAGNKLTLTDSNNKTTQFQYDSLNRLTRVTDPLSNYEDYGYDLLNNKISLKDKRGYTTNYAYNKLNRLTSETNPQNTVINYTYDANSNRLTENIAGKITSYEYDELNRLKKRIEPGNKIFNFGYDASGNKTSETDANSNSLSYTYDKLDRLTKKTLPEGEINYVFDQWNNLTSLSDLSGTTNYTYDLLNRNTNEAKTLTGLAGTFNVGKEYFADSGLKSITDAGNKKVNYAYNNRGLLDNVTYSTNNLATYTHTSFGKPLTITYGNGVIATYAYDELQRPKSIETKLGASTLFKQDYSYDQGSNRAQLVESKLVADQLVSSTVNYTYDSLNQVTKADYNHLSTTQDLVYNYDVWGNRTSYNTAFGTSAYTYNANTNEIAGLSLNNRLNIAYTTDGNGNISKEVYSLLGKNNKTINYAWGSENRLNSITYQVPNQTNNTLNFVYDDLGNRVKKSVNSDPTYYINNGLTVLNEVSTTGTISKTIVSGLGQIAEIDKDNNLQYIHQDILGSTVLITNSAGAIVHQYSYDPFGNIASELGEDANTSNYLYTNQEFDAESELYYYNARYYNPLLGRFISKDPITHRGDGVLGYNEYIYVMNNPLKYTDPSGEEAKKQQEESWYSSAWNSTKDFAKEYGTKILDGGQFILDVAGLVPGVGELADGANALIYEARGDHLNAGLSAAAMIPFAGWLSTGGKFVNKAIKYSDEAASLIKGATKEVKQVEKVINKAPDFIVTPKGDIFPVPKGAVGPVPANSGKGFKYINGNGGNGLNEAVSDFRFMDPVTSGKYKYPDGYGSYNNALGHTVNPLTGKQISPSDPWWHITQ